MSNDKNANHKKADNQTQDGTAGPTLPFGAEMAAERMAQMLRAVDVMQANVMEQSRTALTEARTLQQANIDYGMELAANWQQLWMSQTKHVMALMQPFGTSK